MSELMDKLERASTGAVKPMGFGTAAKREKIAPVLLLGGVAAGSEAEAKSVTDAALDAALVNADASTKKVDLDRSAKALKGSTWGVWRAEAQADAPNGCDFQVFSSDATPIAAFGDEEHTTVMEIVPELDDSQLRTIEDLPVDAFLVSLADAGKLDVKQLMRLARVRGVTSKWLLVRLVSPPAGGELAVLRDAGVDAIVIDVAGQDIKALKSCREALLELPHQAPNKRRNRVVATVPSLRPAAAPPRREEEEEDDYDDD